MKVKIGQRCPAGACMLARMGGGFAAGFDVAVWHCLMLPAATPLSIVERLNRETVKALQSAEVKEEFSRQGAEAKSSTPQALDNYIRVEIARWRKVARDAGMKPTN